MSTCCKAAFHVDRRSGNNTRERSKREQSNELHRYSGSVMMGEKDGEEHSLFILIQSSLEVRKTA